MLTNTKSNKLHTINDAVKASDLGQHVRACEIYLSLMKQNLLDDSNIFNFASLLEQMGQPDRALKLFLALPAKSKLFTDAQLRCGDIFYNANRYEICIEYFSRAIKTQPGHLIAFNKRARAHLKLSQFDKAIRDINKAICIAPDYADLYFNRGSIYSEIQQYKPAIKDYSKALFLNKKHLNARNNRAIAYRELGFLKKALIDLDQAESLNPKNPFIAWNKGLTLLLSGDFDSALPLLENRLAIPNLGLNVRNYNKPKWTGNESLKNKTILLHSEQGLGDSIQFSRYLSFFNQMDCEVLLEIEDSLHTLMTSFLPITKIYSKNQIIPTFDYHSSLVSLPLAFKTSAVSIPNKTPYIKICDKTRIDWLEKLGEKRKPRIGFCWHGNASHSRDKIRSVPLDIFLSHLHPKYDWICLQNNVSLRDLAQIDAIPQVQHFNDELGDFHQTGGLVQCLDAVITVDTSIAHLTGALSTPLHLLLAFIPDARWHLYKTSSVWYESATLHRQPEHGDWHTPIACAVREIDRKFNLYNLKT